MQVNLNDNNSADARLFWNLTEQLERIEVSIDPYNEQDLLEQWTHCIGEVMRRQRSSLPGKFTTHTHTQAIGHFTMLMLGAGALAQLRSA